MTDADVHAELEAVAASLRSLNRLMILALKALHDRGEGDLACRIAADAWSVVRRASTQEADRLHGALHYLVRPLNQKKETFMSDPQHLDVRALPPPQRHALIFEACGKLEAGDAILLVNDHDPKPLYYQFEAEYPGRFSWDYVQSGPDVWKVRIGRKQAA